MARVHGSSWTHWRRGKPLAVCLVLLAGPGISRAAEFIRGDSNGDGLRDIADPQYTLNHLFLGGRAPSCAAAADANDDERVDLSDAVATLGFLFLGAPRLPPPGPLPGTDPTPGLGCGFPAPSALLCRKSGPAVDLTFAFPEPYQEVEVAREGEVVALLAGNARSFRDRPPAGGDFTYRVRGLRDGAAGEPASCRVIGVPQNRSPSVAILEPAPGTVMDAGAVALRGRASDDSGVVRVLVDGAEAASPAVPRASLDFSALVPLGPGPRLVRVEAVDEFGSTAFAELPLGGLPLLETGAAAPGLALHLSGSPGYDEVEAIVRPFLSGVPALIDQGVRGALLFEGVVLGVEVRVTGNRAEVEGPLDFELFPSAEGGGRLGLRARLETVRLHVDGRSDFGLFGTDAWTAVWSGRGVTMETSLDLVPRPGGEGLEATASGFTVLIASSDLQVSGFLDPLGIFDGLVNFLADLFRAQIEEQVRTAVEETLDRQLLPLLSEAFSRLRFDLRLGELALATFFRDARESAEGLSILLDAAWRGAGRDAGFPAYPGSKAAGAPYPAFPLPVTAPHPVDATIALAGDSLNQALFELVSAGAFAAEIPLPTGSPLPFTVGTLAVTLDPRLALLPGVEPEDPLGVRVELRFPPLALLAEGAAGRPLVGWAAPWRWRSGLSDPPAGWKDPGFDDRSWERGLSGFGYSSSPEELREVLTPLPELASGASTSLYTRTQFQLADPQALGPLRLRVLCDDGFVAYLNGEEVGRANLAGERGAPVPSSQLADAPVEPGWTEIDLAPFRRFLRSGENVLAVQGHNSSAQSSDLLLLAELLEPAPLPPDSLGAIPVQVELKGLEATFLADTGGDGVGAEDADGRPDEVDLFTFSLDLRLQGRVLLRAGGEGPAELELEFEIGDGPDADLLPDGLRGGATGIRITVAGEVIDIEDRFLLEFAQALLAFLGASLGEVLLDLELPAVPLPELAFDLDGDEVPEVRLGFQAATLVAPDTDGDRRADWISILADLSAGPAGQTTR